MTIKVLVCDDSLAIRALLKRIIDAQPDMEVVGAAPDPLVAREMVKDLNPDVLTLDVEMPRMDGLEFLERLMRLRPMPVVMISTLTAKGSETTLRALELGAFDYISKPVASDSQALAAYSDQICDKIREACKARIRKPPVGGRPSAAEPTTTVSMRLPDRVINEKFILIGASTGGTEAIKEVLTALPGQCPPILMVQHMPEMFTGSFAKRLDSLCAMQVKEAEHGDLVKPGTAYLAPGHSHLLIVKRGGSYYCELSKADPVNRHRPSVDVLFDAAAPLIGNRSVAAILTGMGKDGAKGLLKLREAGAWTIAQDEASCVVYGMPREAAQIGGASEVASLKDIATRIMSGLAGGDRKSA